MTRRPNDARLTGGIARLALAVLVAAATLIGADAAQAQSVAGSGSTFVQPLLNRWSQSYLRSLWTAESQPAGGLDYEAVGSQAGVMRLKDRAVDFGATEAPLSSEEVRRYGVAQFPIVIGGVVAAVNLPGVEAGRLKLSGEVLADIYLGKVKTWSDPAIKAMNPDLALPDAEIVAVRRSEGSGTTLAFTSFLAKKSPAWGAVGSGLQVAWPIGVSARGNSGVAETVKRTANAVGYVDFASARRAGLSVAALRNRDGAFVVPGVESFQAAAATAEWSAADDFGVALVDAAGEAAYPIVATTFVLVPDVKPAAARTAATVEFFNWCLERGVSDAADLGYVPLPQSVVEQVRRYWGDKLGLAPAVEPVAGVAGQRRSGL